MIIPEYIKVIKDFTCHKFSKPLEIKVGEIGHYFAHTDVYTFEAREGYVPYVERSIVMRNNIHFLKLNSEDQICSKKF